jgi:hypothetical protein
MFQLFAPFVKSGSRGRGRWQQQALPGGAGVLKVKELGQNRNRFGALEPRLATAGAAGPAGSARSEAVLPGGHRKETDGQLQQLERTVGPFAIEQERISGFHGVFVLAVAVDHLAGEHVDELRARVLEERENV